MTPALDVFARDGCVVVPAVFTDDLPRLRETLDRIVGKVTADPARYDTRYTARDDNDIDTWGVNHVFRPDLYEDPLSEIFDNPVVWDFLTAVLGDELRFWSAHALWSPVSVDYQLNWHRDYGEHDRWSPDGQPTHVQFNVCLTPESSFRVVPGSHRRALTPAEREQVDAKGAAPLPGETVIECEAGDVLFMNAHALHRGECAAGRLRRTFHFNVQAADEPTGGQTSWQFMRDPGYLDRMSPRVRQMMERTIAWDDAHPLDLAEMRRRMRISRDIKAHVAGRPGAGTGAAQ